MSHGHMPIYCFFMVNEYTLRVNLVDQWLIISIKGKYCYHPLIIFDYILETF